MSILDDIAALSSPQAMYQAYSGANRRQGSRLNPNTANEDQVRRMVADRITHLPPESVGSGSDLAWWQYVLEGFDLPRNAIHQGFIRPMVEKLSGRKMRPSSKEKAFGLRKSYGSDILRHFGWKPKSLPGKVGQFVAGLGIDIVTDPLSALAGLFGWTKASKGFQQVAKASASGVAASRAPHVKRASEMARWGKQATELAKMGRPAEIAGHYIKPQHVPEALGRVQKIVGKTGRLDEGGLTEAVQRSMGQMAQQQPGAFQKYPLRFGLSTEGARVPYHQLATVPFTAFGRLPATGLRTAGISLQARPGALTSGVGTLLETAGKVLDKPFHAIQATAGKLAELQAKLPNRSWTVEVPSFLAKPVTRFLQGPFGRHTGGVVSLAGKLAGRMVYFTDPEAFTKAWRDRSKMQAGLKNAISEWGRDEAASVGRFQQTVNRLADEEGYEHIDRGQAEGLFHETKDFMGRIWRAWGRGDKAMNQAAERFQHAIRGFDRYGQPTGGKPLLPTEIPPELLLQELASDEAVTAHRAYLRKKYVKQLELLPTTGLGREDVKTELLKLTEPGRGADQVKYTPEQVDDAMSVLDRMAQVHSRALGIADPDWYWKTRVGEIKMVSQPEAQKAIAAGALAQQPGKRPWQMTKAEWVRPEAAPPTADLRGEAGYVYHATNTDNLYGIANDKLRTHKPGEFTDQTVWPDGSTEQRSYFSDRARNVWSFAPEEGRPAILRAKRADYFRKESTGDIYTTRTIPPDDLEVLGVDGDWHNLVEFAADHKEHVRRAVGRGQVVPPDVLAEYPDLDPRQSQLFMLDSDGQTVKGLTEFTQDGLGLIRLARTADISTVMHEFWHTTFPLLDPVSMGRMQRWATRSGWKRGNWNDLQERTAKAFETYFYNGKAPTRDLQDTFDNLSDAMVGIYGDSLKPPRGPAGLTEGWFEAGEKNSPEQVFETLLGRPHYNAKMSGFRKLTATPRSTYSVLHAWHQSQLERRQGDTKMVQTMQRLSRQGKMRVEDPVKASEAIEQILNPADFFGKDLGQEVRNSMLRYEELWRMEQKAGLNTPYIQTGVGPNYIPRIYKPGPLGEFLKSQAQKIQNALRADVTDKELRHNLMTIFSAERRKAGLPPLPAKELEKPGTATYQLLDALVAASIGKPVRFAQSRKLLTTWGHMEIQRLSEKVLGKGILELDPVELFQVRGMETARAVADSSFLRDVAAKDIGVRVFKNRHGKYENPSGRRPVTEAFGKFGDIFDDGHSTLMFRKQDVGAMRRMLNPDRGMLMKAYDATLRLWKSVVLATPMYSVCNAMGDSVAMVNGGLWNEEAFEYAHALTKRIYLGRKSEELIASGTLKRGTPRYAKALKDMGEYTDGSVRWSKSKARPGKQMSPKEWYHTFSQEHPMFGRGEAGVMREADKIKFMSNDGEWDVLGSWGRKYRQQREQLGKLGARALQPFSGTLDAIRTANQILEDHRRMAGLLTRMKYGDKPAQAYDRTMRYLFDYSDLEPALATTGRRLIPFIAWMRKNAEMQWYLAANRPQYLALVAKIHGNLEASFAGQETIPKSLTPRYIAEELGTQMTGVKGAKADFLNMTRIWPVKELGAPLQPVESFATGMSPLLRVPFELAMNRDLFFKKPIKRYEGERKELLGMKVPPAVKHIAHIGPVGLTQQAVIGGQTQRLTGLRLYPTDLLRSARGRDQKLAAQMSSVRYDIRKGLNKAQQAGRDGLRDPDVARLFHKLDELKAKQAQLPLKEIRSWDRHLSKERRDLLDQATSRWEQQAMNPFAVSPN